jgi:hypothetical protein
MSANSNPKISPLESALAIQTGLVFLAIWLGHKQLMYAALALGLLCLISPLFAVYLSKFWMGLSKVLAMIIPNILFSLFFFLFFTPVSVLKRLFSGKNEMDIKSPNKSSMLRNTSKKFTPEQFENTW